MQPDPMQFAQAMMGGPEALAPALEGMAAGMGSGAPMAPADAGMGPGMDPSSGAESAGAPFPSIDPLVIAEIVAQVKGLQEQDHMKLQMQQDTVLAAVMEAMSAGSEDPSLGVAEGAAFGAPEEMPADDQGMGY